MPTVTAPADTMPADTSFADTDLTGRRQLQQSVRHARVRRRLRALLLAALAGSVVIPLVVLALLPSRTNPELMRDASLATSLVGISMLVGAFLLPSRLRTVSEALGIERLLRSHRALAVIGTALALGHAAAAAAHAPHGLLILDLRTAPPRVWAACAATLSLIAIVVLGLTRRRRRPRYEGWRLVHILLANIAVVGTTLHVIWLNDLTRTPVARAWFLVLLLVVALVNGHRWIHRPWRAKRTPYTVEEVRRETASAVTLVLRAEGHPGTPFRPGQFAFLKIGQSAHIFEEHPFSIASAATKPWRKELTIKAIGDFSEVVGGLRPGRRVHLDAAHGGFTPDGLHSDGLVLIAGGVGVTPMLSIVRTLADRHDQRPVVLVVAGRVADDLLHLADREHLERRLRLRVVEILEEPPAQWSGEVGRFHEKILDAVLPAARSRKRFDYFICGPGPMVGAVTGLLDQRSVPRRRVHTELFDVV